jgi:predicted Zn-dependent peptidase
MLSKKFLTMQLLVAFLVVIQGFVTAQKTYHYETIENDPFEARIYTLDNGLKVYFSKYGEEPRIQTFVAVRVGSKNDPSETTGLAHYFEHMMFKGTERFGTTNWEKEKVLIQEIEDLFEFYRQETDQDKRAAIYREIDSISYIASTLAIPNEYDRLMSAIGSRGTNAGTSNDYTIYMENIPSNQIENWAMLQADRFANPVLRLFHTELETVYEEKNMSLTNDGRKASEALLSGLFPNHPYGQQTTLGDAEHLKNPSMKNIREFFDQYYVANNMAVIMAGDFDPDEAIVVVDQYFGTLEPGDVPGLSFDPEPPLSQPVEIEVVGLEAESVQLAWRFEGYGSEQTPLLDMVNMILYNGKAGLIDQNLNKQMVTLGSYAWVRRMTDYAALTLSGRNKSEQTLEEVKDLLLGQIELLRQGKFPDWLMEAAINNLRLQEMRRTESASARAWLMAASFLNDVPWDETVNYINTLNEITREDIIRFANEHLHDDNYVVVYKRQGQADDIPVVEKPPITPIHINRDAESEVLAMVKEKEVEEIEPVFLDYQNDIQRTKLDNGIEILYVENTENPTFSLSYYFPVGSYDNKMLSFAGSFIDYLGTDEYSAEDISNEFYKLACSFNIRVDSEETRMTLSGLSENLEAAVILFDKLVMNAAAEKNELVSFIDNQKKARLDSKSIQRTNFSALTNYAMYGPENPTTFTLTNEELDNLEAEQMIDALKDLWQLQHKVVFYGPQSIEKVAEMVTAHHQTPENLRFVNPKKRFKPLETDDNTVYFAHYDANQSYLQTISKGVKYDKEMAPEVRMYNTYFGGGMNAIVFQEMREKRGLAYSAGSGYRTPSTPDDYFMNTSFIATQNDKVIDAFDAFNDLFENIPLSEKAFTLARDQIISDISTARILKSGIIYSYIRDKKMGFDTDSRLYDYRLIPEMTLDDVKAFNNKYVNNRPKTYVILGHKEQIDFDQIEEKYGPVRMLSETDLFVF